MQRSVSTVSRGLLGGCSQRCFSSQASRWELHRRPDGRDEAQADEAEGHFWKISRTDGAQGFPNVNARYRPDVHSKPSHVPTYVPSKGAAEKHWDADWSSSDLQSATDSHVMLTWGPSGNAGKITRIVRGEGIYLYDEDDKQYLDLTSQAVCSNFGHTVPEAILKGITKQMEEVPYIYGGLGMVPVRSRLSKLMAEITPSDISGFLFPCGGAEANEAAIRIARRYTGKNKILTQYRSYHGGTTQTLGATGDFRRWFTEATVNGFVKIFNPQPLGFTWGQTDEDTTAILLQVLEEQIIAEGPGTIAGVMLESIVGAGGVLVPPAGYMEGVRALCDKYEILLMLDEVMVGFGRTGELWAFQHFNGVVPDILTSAKGLTGAYLPMAVVGIRTHIKEWFHDKPLGWGATYHAHPTTMACAYECVKYMLSEKLPQRAKELEAVMLEEIQNLIDNHPSVKQGRAIGLFGCIDLVSADGSTINSLGTDPPVLHPFRKALKDNGIITLFRPPLLHIAPPLIITELELRDAFQRLSLSLNVLDQEIAKEAALTTPA